MQRLAAAATAVSLACGLVAAVLVGGRSSPDAGHHAALEAGTTVAGADGTPGGDADPGGTVMVDGLDVAGSGASGGSGTGRGTATGTGAGGPSGATGSGGGTAGPGSSAPVGGDDAGVPGSGGEDGLSPVIPDPTTGVGGIDVPPATVPPGIDEIVGGVGDIVGPLLPVPDVETLPASLVALLDAVPGSAEAPLVALTQVLGADRVVRLGSVLSVLDTAEAEALADVLAAVPPGDVAQVGSTLAALSPSQLVALVDSLDGGVLGILGKPLGLLELETLLSAAERAALGDALEGLGGQGTGEVAAALAALPAAAVPGAAQLLAALPVAQVAPAGVLLADLTPAGAAALAGLG